MQSNSIAIHEDKVKGYRILSIDAADLYDYVMEGKPYCICDSQGQIDFDRFTASIYKSLETEQLQKVYEQEKKNRHVKGSFELKDYTKDGRSDRSQSRKKDYRATLAVINVTFKRSVKPNKRVIADTKQLRKLLYENGIRIQTLRGTGDNSSPVTNTYVRYKRSAGSSREGHCLFILEPLKNKMLDWSACGFEPDKVTDKVSWESYVSLTLSNAVCKIRIPKEAILIIPDATSCFQKEVVTVRKDGGDIVAVPELTDIKNTIWDGQALLDESVFADNDHLRGKGMALLRNRFFKTCAFNTRLQAWFRDNGITELNQLHPACLTKAKSISDIKLVVTDSSLKSIKLKLSELTDEDRKDPDKCKEITLAAKEQWLGQLEDMFGVVKTEKPTRFFNGQMVQTSYQLINTLDLGETELAELIRPAQAYLTRIMNDPMFMRYYLHCEIYADGGEESDTDTAEDGEDVPEENDEYNGGEENEFTTLRKRVNYELLSRNDDYAKTGVYGDFRQKIKTTYLDKLKKGKLLVHGTNATLFGNGYEMLSAITDPAFSFCAPVAMALTGSEVRCSFFPDSQDLLCARSPHITMGNLLIAQNRISENDVYANYFHLTKEIICVNSIGECLMDRLNGCDFDSDAMLVTDNPILLKAAQKHDGEFGVPVGVFEYQTENKAIWEVDTDIAQNAIGEIVNLSQWLNSIFWDKLHRGEWDRELYYDICKLAVLSGIEIDKAKRNYGISAQEERRKIKKAHTSEKTQRPSFMKLVKKQTHWVEEETSKDKTEYSDQYHTAMQTLQQIVETETERKEHIPRIDLGSFLRPLNPGLTNEYGYGKEIVKELHKRNRQLKQIRKGIRRSSISERVAIWEQIRMIEEECVTYVKKKTKNQDVTRLLVQKLDENDPAVSHIRSLLLSCICSADNYVYDQVYEAGLGKPRYELIPDAEGTVEIYGIKHTIRQI
jgi:hypothetical protein